MLDTCIFSVFWFIGLNAVKMARWWDGLAQGKRSTSSCSGRRPYPQLKFGCKLVPCTLGMLMFAVQLLWPPGTCSFLVWIRKLQGWGINAGYVTSMSSETNIPISHDMSLWNEFISAAFSYIEVIPFTLLKLLCSVRKSVSIIFRF